jgi:pantoate--beta-alanine ligase
LVRISRELCDATIATIFVNPTQFGPGEDLEQYPRMMERDSDLLREEGVAAIFAPSRESMYPDGFSTMVDPPAISKTLEGEFRPDHFRGVATIVMKLFQCLPCDRAVFGRKDYQQLKVIEAMTRDLNVGIEIVDGDIIRESDGLAMSSRNRYLSDAERGRALRLSEALRKVERAVDDGQRSTDVLQQIMQRCLKGLSGVDEKESVKSDPNAASGGVDQVDYAVVVDAETLEPLDMLDRPAVALIAARVGSTRLIDNQVLTPTLSEMEGR